MQGNEEKRSVLEKWQFLLFRYYHGKQNVSGSLEVTFQILPAWLLALLTKAKYQAVAQSSLLPFSQKAIVGRFYGDHCNAPDQFHYHPLKHQTDGRNVLDKFESRQRRTDTNPESI